MMVMVRELERLERLWHLWVVMMAPPSEFVLFRIAWVRVTLVVLWAREMFGVLVDPT